MRRHFALCCLFAALLLQASAVGAAQYSLLATGTITSLEEENLAFDGSISIGTPFSVSLSFDTDTVTVPDPSAGGHYEVALPYFLNAEVGNYAFYSGIEGFVISVDPDDQRYLQVYALNPIALGSVPPSSYFEIRFQLADPVEELLSDELDPLLFDLARWDRTEFSFYACRCSGSVGGSVDALGTVDSLTLTAVPEPSTGALLLCGLVALARRRRR